MFCTSPSIFATLPVVKVLNLLLCTATFASAFRQMGLSKQRRLYLALGPQDACDHRNFKVLFRPCTTGKAIEMSEQALILQTCTTAWLKI